ncbi:hypothetical protein Hypma_009267 [Hypsizygus marmoreus]|uniref:Uncharacterized protein n=1 Tax=Hypsizygus marmoreus TaxID=39966 RepID=A0A369JNU9_HYPMA|nr:hypothetical protein Hypma_009267 [Hypsizygus marmoreus]
MSKKTILVYATHPLPDDIQASVIHQFNHPKGSAREKASENSHNQFALAAATIGQTVDDVAALHLNHTRAVDQANGAHVDGSLIIVADDGMSPASHPQTVLMVKLLSVENKKSGGEARERYQAVRVLASSVGPVFAEIQTRQNGWEDIWAVAQANGGHFPGQ